MGEVQASGCRSHGRRVGAGCRHLGGRAVGRNRGWTIKAMASASLFCTGLLPAARGYAIQKPGRSSRTGRGRNLGRKRVCPEGLGWRRGRRRLGSHEVGWARGPTTTASTLSRSFSLKPACGAGGSRGAGAGTFRPGESGREPGRGASPGLPRRQPALALLRGRGVSPPRHVGEELAILGNHFLAQSHSKMSVGVSL